jgi:outer membrane receptor for ferrienterochelin and colicins
MMKPRRHLYLSLCLLSLNASSLSGDEAGLEALLDDATQVVTSSKLNLDYTPSVVTVLEQSQLQALGIQTLFEALGLLPGIETSVNQFGIKKVIFRGFDNPNNFVFDKAKFLIDGVAIEMGKYGNSSFYYDFPVDLIERIEVLRGPGSALYGTGAFNGAINVVTRQKAGMESTLFAAYGSDDFMKGGGHVRYAPTPDSHLHLDAYYQRHDRQIDAGREYAPIALDRDYESNEQLRDFSIGLSYVNGPWSFRSRIKNDTNGNYFGWDEYLEPGSGLRNTHRHFFAELEYSAPLAPDTELTAKLGYSRYSFDMEAISYHIVSPVFAIPYTIDLEEEEAKGWLEGAVTTRSYEGHEITSGVSMSTLRGLDNELDVSITVYGPRDLFKEHLMRNVFAAYVRDTITIDPKLRLLLAARADHYSENDKTYPSAQAGLVYLANDNWHYKLNYGHAFRVPSWIEQYTVEYQFASPNADGTRAGNPNLEAETTDTVEAVAIWRDGEVQHLQANLYYSMINNVIDIDFEHAPESEYANLDRRTSYGLESSYTYVTPALHRFHINGSYNRTTYEGPLRREEQAMPGVAQVMLKGNYTHYLTPATTLSAEAKYFGQRARNEDFDGSANEDAGCDDYAVLNLILGTKSAGGWIVTAAIKNLLDADIEYPSYNAKHDGIPREGRTFVVQTEYQF